jgi:hypothetical protein
MEAGVGEQPPVHHGCLVGGEVVADHVDRTSLTAVGAVLAARLFAGRGCGRCGQSCQPARRDVAGCMWCYIPVWMA